MGDAATEPLIATGLEEAAGRPSLPELVPADQWPDPHPHYHRMRTETPIKPFPEWDEFVFTRYADCERILRDPTMSSSPDHRRMKPEIPAMMDDFAERPTTMLMMDPPDHTRLRKLVSKAFTPRTVETLRPHVAELVNGMLDAVDPTGFDLISTVGYPLPTTVICELLGIPAEDQPLFGPWSSDASRMLDGDLDDATIQRGMLAFMSLINYLNGIFEERRANPRDDLLSALLAAEEEGDRLSEEELRSTVVLLFVAGHETTTNLIGNGTVAMLRQRDAVGPALRRPVAGARRGGGVPPLRRARAPHRPHRHRRVRGGRTADRGGPGLHHAAGGGQPRSRSASPTPTGSTSPGPTTTTSPSATASTTAWARRWPGSRARRRSRRSPSGSPPSTSPRSRCTASTSCSAATKPCTSPRLVAPSSERGRRSDAAGLIRLTAARRRGSRSSASTTPARARCSRFAPLARPPSASTRAGPPSTRPQTLGNMRSQLFPDLLRRVLVAAGYDVTFVTNITDVGHLVSDADEGDDKMERRPPPPARRRPRSRRSTRSSGPTTAAGSAASNPTSCRARPRTSTSRSRWSARSRSRATPT